MAELEDLVTRFDSSDFVAMSDGELLDAVRAVESVFRDNSATSSLTDHRRHLSRQELEVVFRLVKRRAELKSLSMTTAIAGQQT